MKKKKSYIRTIFIVLALVIGYSIVDKVAKSNYEKRINNVSTYNEIIEVKKMDCTTNRAKTKSYNIWWRS